LPVRDGADLLVRPRNRWPRWLPVPVAWAVQQRVAQQDACAWSTSLPPDDFDLRVAELGAEQAGVSSYQWPSIASMLDAAAQDIER
jgi:hypothetical protein